jgi:hypothetical protein
MKLTRLVAVLFLIACHTGHQPKPEALAASPTAALEAARQRPQPDPLRGKFSIKIKSAKLGVAATTTGGLLTDRPGRLRFDLFGPFGGSLFTAISDGAGLSVLDVGKQRQLLGADAETILREAAGGVAGLDDVIALLTGDIPFDTATVTAIRSVTIGDRTATEYTFAGPKDTAVTLLVDPDLGTPLRIAAQDAAHQDRITATYEPFARVPSDAGDGPWMPTSVSLQVASLDLAIDLRFRSWDAIDGDAPSFSTAAPPGFAVTPLEDALRAIAASTPTPAAAPVSPGK